MERNRAGDGTFPSLIHQKKGWFFTPKQFSHSRRKVHVGEKNMYYIFKEVEKEGGSVLILFFSFLPKFAHLPSSRFEGGFFQEKNSV